MTGTYFDRVLVLGVANEQVLKTALTSTEEEQKTVVSVSVIEVTGALQGDAIISGMIEREEVLNVAVASTLLENGSDHRLPGAEQFELNHVLPVGQALKLGHVSGGVASNLEFTVKYTIA